MIISGRRRAALGSTAALILLVATAAQATLYEKGAALGQGARSMGMAGACAASAADESAIWWNPAGLGEVDALRLDSTLGSVYDGRQRLAGFAAAVPLPAGAGAGFMWQHAFYPQAVETNTDLLGFGGSLPLSQDHRLRLGGTFKVLFGGVRAQGGDFQGLGLDVGLRYRLPLFRDGEALSFGARIQDVDTRLQWGNGRKEQVPQSLAAGVAYYFDAATVFETDLEVIQGAQPEGAQTRVLRAGAERWFRDLIGVRAGYLLDSRRLSTFTAGLGFKYAGWELEYGLLGQVSDLGFSHRLSLAYGLPPLKVIQAITPVQAVPAPVRTADESSYKLAFTAVPPVFSPNGDGRADSAEFGLRLLAGERDYIAAWRLSIEDRQGAIVRYYDGAGYPEKLSWDGRDNREKLCGDGIYLARLLLADAHEKRLAHAETFVTLRTQLPQILLQAQPENLTVVGGQPESKVSFMLLGGAEVKDVSWQLQLRTPGGKPWRTLKGEGDLPQALVWNGLDDAQQVPAAGAYEAYLTVHDAANNEVTDTLGFQVVQLETGVNLDCRPKVFKPGDPREGKVAFRLAIVPPAKVSAWQLTLRDAETNRVVRTLSGSGASPATVIWDGTTAKGELVAGGKYFYSQLKATFTTRQTLESPVRALASDISNQDSGKSLALHLTAVTFESGSDVIPIDAFKNLQMAAETVKRYAKQYQVQLLGYTDSQEAPEAELELSRARALKVKDYLASAGKIPADVLAAVGYGSANPLASESSRVGKAKNRRVEVVLIIQK